MDICIYIFETHEIYILTNFTNKKYKTFYASIFLLTNI